MRHSVELKKKKEEDKGEDEDILCILKQLLK